MEPCTEQLAYGADLLRAKGESVTCFVCVRGEKIACRWNGTLNGAAILVRISDGRECNFPVPFAQIVFSEDVAWSLIEARSERKAGVRAAQIWAMQHQGKRPGQYSQGVGHYNSRGGYR